MREGVTDAGQQTNEQTVKIELLSQWKLEAEFRKHEILLTTFESFLKCLPIDQPAFVWLSVEPMEEQVDIKEKVDDDHDIYRNISKEGRSWRTIISEKESNNLRFTLSKNGRFCPQLRSDHTGFQQLRRISRCQ